MSDRQLRYGIYMPLFGPLGDPVAVVDLAERAEAAGWDGFFTWDHVNSDGAQPIADPWVSLGAIAQATERLRLGPMVVPLPRRRPWVVARHSATLSRLSAGRLIVGCGLGTDEFGDLSQFGEPTELATRSAQFDQAIQIIRAMWDGRPYHEDGQHYQVNIGPAEPEPYRIPVWVASSAGGQGAAARAARSDGIFPNPGDHQLSADERKRESGMAGDSRCRSERPGRGWHDLVDGVADPL
jgi:alkanesulfonate monooxygenase SsuD/methylene tetrahydromethanopterin reductase-like flavin-dependent oxidoreductase (luciferase family)